MTEEKSLTVVEQKQVEFYQDEILAVRTEDGSIFIPVRPLCERLGVDWSAQRQRLTRDIVLSEVLQGVVITTTPSEEGRGGGPQEMLCLPLEFINGWLFGINASRVNPEVRERLLTYQRQCYKVLADAFQGTAVATSVSPVLLQVREMGRAIMQMADEQMEFERRLTVTEGRLEIIGKLDERLAEVEKQLSPGSLVTQEQASQISQSVKAVALALGKRTKKNEFGAVYGELYRKFGITSYKMLPVKKFEAAINFLTEWHQNLEGDAPF
ncbi:MAG: hypothetical protein CL608_31400 [Anaerolineaceae bacterium]|nr:hypothetical protein [Anaerolineaceae bacterium]